MVRPRAAALSHSMLKLLCVSVLTVSHTVLGLHRLSPSHDCVCIHSCFAYLHNPFPPLAWIADTPATPMHGNCAYTSAPMDCYNGTLFVSSGYHAHEWALMCYLKGAAKDAMPTCIDRPGQGDTHMPLTLATADPNPPPPSRFAVDASCSTQCSSTPAFKALNLKTEADAVKVLKTGRV